MRVNAPGPRATLALAGAGRGCVHFALGGAPRGRLRRPRSRHRPRCAASATRATLDRYCVTCHNQRARSGELALDTLDLATSRRSRDLGKGACASCAPAPCRRRDAAARRGHRGRARVRADDRARPGRHAQSGPAAAAAAESRRVRQRRFATCSRSTSTCGRCCPPDDSAFGFDNNADLLGVSPALLERYLVAADRVSALAVGDPTTAPGLRHLLHARRSVAEPASSKGCRSARSAASASATRSRSTANTNSASSSDAHQPRGDSRARASASARDHGGRRARVPRPRSAARPKPGRPGSHHRRDRTPPTRGCACACR